MQVRFVFEPELEKANARWAFHMIPLLSQALAFKAEPLSKASLNWKDHYASFSRVQTDPQIQLYWGPPESFKAHPLQWNIVIDASQQMTGADEYWVFSPQSAQGLQVLGVPAEQIQLLPLATQTWQAQSVELPMELSEKHILFASLNWSQQTQLKAILKAYLPTFCGQTDTALALHLDPGPQAADAQQDEIETQLMTLLESLAAETQSDLEKLNLETWIGKLDTDSYFGVLNRADVLVAPANPLCGLEAIALGKKVVNIHAQSEISGEDLKAALSDRASDAPVALTQMLEAMVKQIERIQTSVDFEARSRSFQASQQAAQQGRKQKYSLFHSDYNEPEMQARRNWHARYAKFFEGIQGDVLDIGCGSGIFLEILRDWGQAACGIDLDPAMVEVCESLGLQAIVGDDQSLSQWQSQSLGGIHASHIIEHIDGSRAIQLVENAFRVLRPGGKLIVRTPNWRNDQVRHEGFWLDITHVRPYPLPLLKQVFEDAGFVIEQMGFEEFGWNDTFIVGRKGDA